MNTGSISAYGEERNRLIVVAVGGNALLTERQRGTFEEQMENVEYCATELCKIIQEGYQMVLTHGNGPQIGLIMLRDSFSRIVRPVMPLYVYSAESQGQIGFLLMRSLCNHVALAGIQPRITTILTQVLVRKDDPAFSKPTKPVGPFYTLEEMEELQKISPFPFVEDSGRGYRKAVCSPEPVAIVESSFIKGLTSLGLSIIAGGGGGIPLVRNDDGTLSGCEAVIDKDLGGELLAEDCDADVLFLLTAVEHVAINFGKPNQEELEDLTADEAERLADEGQFGKGSMEPKVRAAIKFARSRKGRTCIIGALDKAAETMAGLSGTRIHE